MASGKSSRARTKARRKKERDAKKAAYEALRDAGKNQKHKLAGGGGRVGARVERHRLGPCGNTGCAQCNPDALSKTNHKAWRRAQLAKAHKAAPVTFVHHWPAQANVAPPVVEAPPPPPKMNRAMKRALRYANAYAEGESFL
jgi:hypothetical protein